MTRQHVRRFASIPMKSIPILLTLCAAALLMPLPSHAAESLRCGSRLASVGMTAAEVLSVCGEPGYRDVWAQPGGYGGGYLGNVEEWTYNFGSSQLLRVMRFRQRSEEHTSELQSLMRISYAVFCLKKKNYHRYENQ